MKIILATALYPPEIETLSFYSQAIAQQLKSEHELTVLAYATHFEKTAGINIIAVNKRQPIFFRLLGFSWQLFKLSRKADLIYVQNSLAVSLPAVVVKFFRRIPVVINFAEDEAWKRSLALGINKTSLDNFLAKSHGNRKIKLIMALQSWTLRRAARVQVGSQTLANLMVKYYKVSQKNIVINYPVELEHESLPFAVSKKEQQLFTNFCLPDWTALDTLMQAIALLKTKFLNLKLVVAGDFLANDKLHERIKELSIVDNIYFLGRISQVEKWYWRKASELYVSGLAGFDFSHDITQSILAELPVVATRGDYAREIITDKQNGLLTNISDSQDLADKIETLLNDKTLAKELVSKAKTGLEENF
ncbi:glycosyltransferase, partial [Candidatus Parcubacteria bacterium]